MLDGAPHAAIGVDVSAGAGSSIAARAALLDPTIATSVASADPGVHAIFAGVPATASEIRIALANDDTVDADVGISVADE